MTRARRVQVCEQLLQQGWKFTGVLPVALGGQRNHVPRPIQPVLLGVVDRAGAVAIVDEVLGVPIAGNDHGHGLLSGLGIGWSGSFMPMSTANGSDSASNQALNAASNFGSSLMAAPGSCPGRLPRPDLRPCRSCACRSRYRRTAR